MMKNKAAYIFALVFGTAVWSPAPNLFAGGTHTHKHVDELEYDPVETDFGMYEPGMEATHNIEVTMSDKMNFTPSLVNVKQGDVVKFTHKNPGQLIHEFVLGTISTLDEHAELMKNFPNMEHSEPYMIHVPPGETGEVIWKFSNAGEFAFGCLIPGHYDAGMKGKIIVES